jgi:hypothetical protein
MRSRLTVSPSALPDLVGRVLARQSDAVATVARVRPLDRIAVERLTMVAQAVSVVLLLALGLAIDASVVWALLAIPMTLIVLLFLAEPELMPAQARAAAARAPIPAPAQRPAPPAPPRARPPEGGPIIVRSALPHRHGVEVRVRRGDATLPR